MELPQTLKDLFQNNYTAVCNYAAVMTKDKHLAEDIVQDVFIHLWEKDKFNQLDKPEAFLLKCVRNKCIDHLRSHKRKNETLVEDFIIEVQDRPSNLKEEEILPLLHYFIGKLPPKTQKVFLMSRQQKMTYKEIAEELNLSYKTIENQMGSALKKLRILLQQHNYLPLAIILFQ